MTVSSSEARQQYGLNRDNTCKDPDEDHPDPCDCWYSGMPQKHGGPEMMAVALVAALKCENDDSYEDTNAEVPIFLVVGTFEAYHGGSGGEGERVTLEPV